MPKNSQKKTPSQLHHLFHPEKNSTLLTEHTQQWLSEAKYKKHGFTTNLNDRTTLLEEMVEQDKLLITRWISNLNACSSEQLDTQEVTLVVSKFLNNSSNVSGMEKFINEKNCETLNKPVKCSMESQQNFFNHLLDEIQFLWKEVRMKKKVIKSLLA